jgi:hypothetical protein
LEVKGREKLPVEGVGAEVEVEGVEWKTIVKSFRFYIIKIV